MRPAGVGDLCCRFTIGELRQVRRAGLAGQRAGDFVLALNEITTNAVRHGSPTAVLRLRTGGQDGVLAEVSDSGRWLVSGPVALGKAATGQDDCSVRSVMRRAFRVDTTALRDSRMPAIRGPEATDAGGDQPGAVGRGRD